MRKPLDRAFVAILSVPFLGPMGLYMLSTYWG